MGGQEAAFQTDERKSVAKPIDHARGVIGRFFQCERDHLAADISRFRRRLASATFGSVRLRYFGPRPLIEDNAVRSRASTLLNLDGGYRITNGVKIAIDVFNPLNAKDSDIDYYYASRLPGEPAGGIDDVHFHPMLPRTARVNLIVGF